MTTNTEAAKSCEPQLFPEGSPTSRWPLEELVAYARDKHDAIAETEKPLAAQYWRLGLALSLARAKFKHGKWGQYLRSLGIDKTRVSKAQAIYEASRAEKDVSGLSVAQAYARRKRKEPPKSKPAVMSDRAELREFLKTICIDAEKYVDVAEFLEPAEVPEFVLDVEKTIRALEELRVRLHQRATQ